MSWGLGALPWFRTDSQLPGVHLWKLDLCEHWGTLQMDRSCKSERIFWSTGWVIWWKKTVIVLESYDACSKQAVCVVHCIFIPTQLGSLYFNHIMCGSLWYRISQHFIRQAATDIVNKMTPEVHLWSIKYFENLWLIIDILTPWQELRRCICSATIRPLSLSDNIDHLLHAKLFLIVIRSNRPQMLPLKDDLRLKL
jgi:hypothetical protein